MAAEHLMQGVLTRYGVALIVLFSVCEALALVYDQYALGVLPTLGLIYVAMKRPIPPTYEWTRWLGLAFGGVLLIMFIYSIWHPPLDWSARR